VLGHKLAEERRLEVIGLLRSGLNPMQAAEVSGVSKSYIYKLHHSLGGVYRPLGVEYSGRYLDRDERYELARLLESGCSQREAARRLGRSASTICREVARNRDPRTGGYQPERAHTMAWQRQRRPKASKIGSNPALRDAVQDLLNQRLSPEQVAGRLRLVHPDNDQMQVSHESIYRSIYVYPRGELARELKATLRSGRTVRRPHGRRKNGSRIVGAVSIAERPEEVEGRLVPGHHEGDLIIGATGSNSAVATIVERVSGYIVLGHIATGRKSEDVVDAVALAMSSYPPDLAKTLTWDRGVEMANHADLTARTGIDVYFADPYKPWQRGSNENVNGLLREYLPKGTDLSVHTPADLQAIADQLNDRPRKRLGFYTPRERLATLIEEDLNRVATTT
jgi:IS30 family transposase